MKKLFLSALILVVLVLGVAYVSQNTKLAGTRELQVAQVPQTCEQARNDAANANDLEPNSVIAISGQAVGLPVSSSFAVNGTPVDYDAIEFDVSEVPSGQELSPSSDPSNLTSSDLPGLVEERIQTSTLSAGSIYSWKVKGQAQSVWSNYSGERYFFVCPS